MAKSTKSVGRRQIARDAHGKPVSLRVSRKPHTDPAGDGRALRKGEVQRGAMGDAERKRRRRKTS